MKQPKNILLVDDEEEFLETTSRRLRRRSFDVKTATRCAEAMPEVIAGWPHVVVLDVMLRNTDGMECLRRIKRQSPQLPVVMLTGHASLQASIQGLEHGASDYCLKPIELDELVEKIIIACKDADNPA
ncbi:MAG: response regulator [Gammaproteobacteria bacterium]|nr:response regulator [Rhodocyclaceae bacterium]MBU3910288.1 response regulator [Gammaproteobacteria bacterium]MBU3995849.1 response regulator [Actinomycetota bacterium]MBU4004115.1 response regulator [Gammaproteobacteria bacterium]MBU4020362.1 response regulator [Gammaproteobacteria bacterium]